jgi:hypothetical protein
MLFRLFRRCHSPFNANWRNALAYAFVSSRTSGPPRGVGMLSRSKKSALLQSGISGACWTSPDGADPVFACTGIEDFELVSFLVIQSRVENTC